MATYPARKNDTRHQSPLPARPKQADMGGSLVAWTRRALLMTFLAVSGMVGVTTSTDPFLQNEPTSPQLVVSHEASTVRSEQSNLRGVEEKKSSHQFGLVVAHCEEDYLTWIDGVDDIKVRDDQNQLQKTTWDPVVYERCGQTVSTYSQWQRNLGSEECTAYLQYIVQRYDDLPDIVYFLQPDSLSYNKEKDHQHTAFNSLQELVSASAPLMKAPPTDSGDQISFLHLGNDDSQPAFSALNQLDNPNNNPLEVIQLMGDRAPWYSDSSEVGVVFGAAFAVRRERIRANPVEFYKDLILKLMSFEDERRLCWSLESTWHVVFGEDLRIPDRSRIMYHLGDPQRPASS